MRTPALTALVLLATLPLTATGAATTPGTPEEAALRAALAGHDADAVSILAAEDDPELRWLAGRYALEAGDYAAAGRLLAGPDPRDVWGRIDIAAAQGQSGVALAAALPQMDAAMAGTHRDALARLLIGWAAERIKGGVSGPPDVQNAARFLDAAITLSPSESVRNEAEDALFRLPPDFSDPERARARLVAASAGARKPLPGSATAARLRYAEVLTTTDPRAAAAELADLLVTDPADATRIGELLTGLAQQVPDATLLSAFEHLPDTLDMVRMRLQWVLTLAERDPPTALAAVSGLRSDVSATDPAAVNALARDLRTARAALTRDPVGRRKLWLDIADAEGRTPAGDSARAAALDALLESATDPTAARAALDTPDGAGNPTLLYRVIPADRSGEPAARTDALWTLAVGFPEGPWCDELATRLISSGATTAEAERFDATCTGGSTSDSPAVVADVNLVRAHAQASTQLRLQPVDGAVDVTASAVKELQVTQHSVDAEALFRGTAGSGVNPLDTTLDAFLLEPDKAWAVPLTGLQTVRVAPRSAGQLAAITVRAGDQRGTALVVSDPLRVQIVGRGDEAVIAVLRGDRPVPNASLLIDDGGTITRGRTGSDGIARTKGTNPVRVMASSGGALGFGTSSGFGGQEDTAEAWSVVLWDRAVPTAGRVCDVQVFGTAPVGSAPSRGMVLESHARDGSTLESVPLVFDGGVGHARLYTQGAGSLALVRDGSQLATAPVPAASAPVQAPVGLTLSTRAPRAGSTTLTAHVSRLDSGSEPLSAEVTITTPWSTTHTAVVLGAESLDLPIDLLLARPGEPVDVMIELADGTTVSATASTAPAGPAPELTGVPPIVALGSSIQLGTRTTSDEQIHAMRTDGPGEVWSPMNRPLTLPSAGLWTLTSWNGAAGPTVYTRVVDPGAPGEPLAADGTWRGPATLFATTAEGVRVARIVQDGGPLDLKPQPGARTAWVQSASGELVPITGPDTPTITVTGTLQRGSPAPLTIDAPAGSHVWAYLRDSAPGPDLTPAAAAPLWDGDAGVYTDPWTPTPTWGVAISAGLLAEEERIHEATDVKRVDFGFSPAAEKSEDSSGYGEGMGGISGRGSGGSGYGASDWATGRITANTPFTGDAVAIGVVDGKAPGAFPFEVPAWVQGADIEVVIRTADGRWATRIVPVELGGELAARPVEGDAPPPPTGDAAELVAWARRLPLDAQLHALEGLKAAGIGSARLPAQAAWALRPPTTPELALARHLAGGTVDVPASGAIPDPHHAERALATLLLAGGDDSQRERARVAAERLLDEPAGPDGGGWVTARAALALWLAGQDQEAMTAASRDPADTVEAAARAVISGTSEPAFVAGWWAIARSAAASPADRALALHALGLPRGKARTLPTMALDTRQTIDLAIEAPLARWHGETFSRAEFANGGRWSGPDAALVQHGPPETPALRTLPIWLVVPANPLPTRLQCPVGAVTEWVDLPPSLNDSRWVDCTLRTVHPGDQQLAVAWFDPLGHRLASGTASLHVTPASDSAATDALSQAEQLGLGTRLASLDGPDRAVGLGLLEGLQRTAELPSDVLAAVSTTLLTGAVGGDPTGLIRGFQSFREHAPDGVLDLATAAALAHAYATAPSSAGGDPRRALAAVRVVMDARFKEELAAVSGLQSGGLDLTALKLLRALVLRYPETPTVSRARFLAPAMLLTRAEGGGDRLGYTRSSLRHTAAAELAGFLLLHRDGWHGTANAAATTQAAQAASTLSDALASLGDDTRQAALAGPLARAFAGRAGAEEVSWLLSLAAAHAESVGANPAGALTLLDHITPPDREATALVALERGRVLEALGRPGPARDAYTVAANIGNNEAAQRLQWLDRTAFVLPSMLTLTPGMPSTVPANLKSGTEVTVTAIAIQLEAALLNSGGTLDSSGVQVTGLRPTATRTLAVGADGDVPIPALPNGAYLLTITTGGVTQTSLLVRTDAELTVQGGGPTLAHLATMRGRALGGAQVWAFQGSGTALSARTDATGTVYFPQAVSSVLARDGDRYALGQGTAGSVDRERLKNLGYMEDYAPAAASPARMNENASEYEGLFKQDADQKVRAEGL